MVGDFKSAGREWQSKGEPEKVLVHDFPGDAIGRQRWKTMGEGTALASISRRLLCRYPSQEGIARLSRQDILNKDTASAR